MAEKQKLSSDDSKFIHYIIAVHGIGQQRKNETVLPIIKQFAAARHANPNQAEFLTLGRLTSQSREQQWIEYQDIPNFPDPSLENQPWIPEVASVDAGKNLCFVDFCWSEITQEQHKNVGEATKIWSQSLINRLKLRVSLGGESTQWIVDMMQTLQEGILFVEKIMDLRIPKLSYKIFGEFLGDVEMYGDFPNTRGRAVRLFHEAMAALHQAHYEKLGDQVSPRYTIIAHSLGTVLTLDAITYAHANNKSRNSSSLSETKLGVVHFPGYNGNVADKLPSVDWVKHLTSYVTLGSPIDKYLALWTENYPHFDNTTWMDKKLITHRKTKIRHFNYSDEQDPVGHELNILKSTPVWQALMESGEDVVFTRYPLPGVAHVDYWKDYDLFYRILDLTIDKRDQPLVKNEKQKEPSPEKQPIEWFDSKVYIKALIISYIVVPFIGWLIATICFDTVIQAFLIPTEIGEPIDVPWTAFILFIITLYLTHVVMELIIKWRLVMVVGRSEQSPMEEQQKRKSARAGIRFIILWSPVLWGLLFIAVLIPGVNSLLPGILLSYLSTLRIMLGLAFFVSLDIRMVYNRSRNNWKNLKNDLINTTFSDYLMPLQKK